MSDEHLHKFASEFFLWIREWSVLLAFAAGAIGGLVVFMWNATIGKLASKSMVSREILLSVKKAEIELQNSVNLFKEYKIETDKDILLSISKAESELQKCYNDIRDELLAHEEREIERQAIVAKENRDEHKRMIDILLDKLK